MNLQEIHDMSADALAGEELRKRCIYDAKTGVFTHKEPQSNRVKVGQVAGVFSKSDGYRYMHLLGRRVGAHILAWLHEKGEYPKSKLDHRNGIKTDNWISNLRLATSSQNNCNTKTRVDNTTGVKGVCFDKQTGMYRVEIQTELKKVHIGRYKDLAEAAKQRKAAEEKYHGSFARAAIHKLIEIK